MLISAWRLAAIVCLYAMCTMSLLLAGILLNLVILVSVLLRPQFVDFYLHIRCFSSTRAGTSLEPRLFVPDLSRSFSYAARQNPERKAWVRGYAIMSLKIHAVGRGGL